MSCWYSAQNTRGLKSWSTDFASSEICDAKNLQCDGAALAAEGNIPSSAASVVNTQTRKMIK